MPRPNPSTPRPRRSTAKNGPPGDPLASATGPLGPALVRNTDEDGTQPLRSLSPEHQEQLIEGSGISEEVIAERGYFTVTKTEELAKLGFPHQQRRVPCLVLPIHDVRAEIPCYQIRPDEPRCIKGKVLKYEFAKNTRPVLDVPKRVHANLKNPDVTLWITEGGKKADSAASRGICCISISGVWSWRGSNDDGGTAALPDWESIALKDRDVVLAFDSDVMANPAVLAALTRLRAFLASRGARVRICLLEPGPDGEKTGLDDFFARGGTVDDLRQRIHDDLPTTKAVIKRKDPYFVTADGLFMVIPSREGEPRVAKVMNFDARIVEELRLDDGAEVQVQFRIEAALHHGTRSAVVSAEDFRELRWIHGQLGSGAIVEVGHPPQRICHAIQTMSDTEVRVVYRHTGWRKVGDEWCFLHADGAIGPLGPVGPLVCGGVDLPEPLRSVCLPSPPTGKERASAVRASLSFTRIAVHQVSWLLLLAVYRAVLGDAGFSLFLVGPTGTRKTSTAAVAQQHFGPGFSLTNLPGNWSSTPNAIEELLFAAKDTLFVLDDFVPPAGLDRGKQDAKADRVLRNTANRAGRQRMRADGTLRPNRPPRGLVLSTGEVLPRGHSLMARSLVVEVSHGDVDLEQLTRLQGLGADGTMAKAMAAFVQWLSPQLEQTQVLRRGCQSHYRYLLAERHAHGRTVDAIAEMYFALDLLLRFAVEVGAIDQVTADALRVEGREALLSVGGDQAAQQVEEDVASAFLRQLLAAIAAGRCHLADATTGSQAPVGSEERCGWRRPPSGNSPPTLPSSLSVWIPQGERIGWIDGDSVFLLPDVAESVALRLARERGEPINITGRSLRKRLLESGHLVSRGRQEGDTRLLTRKTIDGARHDVLHLPAGSLFGAGVDQVDQGEAGGAAPPPAEQGPLASVIASHDPIFDQHARIEDAGEVPAPNQCRMCKDTRSWRTRGGPWTCSTCYPPTEAMQARGIEFTDKGERT